MRFHNNYYIDIAVKHGKARCQLRFSYWKLTSPHREGGNYMWSAP